MKQISLSDAESLHFFENTEVIGSIRDLRCSPRASNTLTLLLMLKYEG